MHFKQVKLPRRFKGRVLKQHPLLEGLKGVMDEGDISMRTLAESQLKITPQALFGWMKAARKNRDFNIPPRQVIKVCRLTGQAPYVYNPDLWPVPEWTV